MGQILPFENAIVWQHRNWTYKKYFFLGFDDRNRAKMFKAQTPVPKDLENPQVPYFRVESVPNLNFPPNYKSNAFKNCSFVEMKILFFFHVPTFWKKDQYVNSNRWNISKKIYNFLPEKFPSNNVNPLPIQGDLLGLSIWPKGRICWHICVKTKMLS